MSKFHSRMVGHEDDWEPGGENYGEEITLEIFDEIRNYFHIELNGPKDPGLEGSFPVSQILCPSLSIGYS